MYKELENVYDYIKGIYKGMHKDYIIVENNGIGYKIFTSGNTLYETPKKDEEIKLYIQQILRDDSINLYGFFTKEERDMFNLLMTISGVGAKSSLSLLSVTSINKLKYSIVTEDTKLLTKAPGIGKKTAERIILELKDKFKNDDIISDIDDIDGVNNLQMNCVEALAALISLGYSQKEAEKALKNVDKENSLEDIIKECLKYLMG